MIETEQSVSILARNASVWDFASNINAWAGLMPGLVSCAIIDANQSRWVLKVGAGALVRTVKVLVVIDRWAGPGAVDFTFSLEGDPVNGNGTYRAFSRGLDETVITLTICVIGSGPMAAMWEALGKPLLPKFARNFADQFKAAVEAVFQVQGTPS